MVDLRLESKTHKDRAKVALVLSIALTVVLYWIPFGRLVAYPLVLLSSLVHELGHGVAALAVGEEFVELAVYVDGSGAASHTSPAAPENEALIAAGGLFGPTIAAAIGFVLARRPKPARLFLVCLTVVLLIALGLVVRELFAAVFVLAVVGGLGWTVTRSCGVVSQFVVVFLSAQLALGVFSRGEYLFTDLAHPGRETTGSDTAALAAALGGTFVGWGAVAATLAIVVLVGGLWMFWRAMETSESPQSAPAAPQ